MTTKRDYEELYKKFFAAATGIKEGPYPYQVRLATEETFPELLDIPTGLGKTAAVVAAEKICSRRLQPAANFIERR